jgi:hypothetical protein
MPVGGAKQKPPGQSVTRHKPVHDWTEVERVPFEGWKLPDARADGRPWMERTKQKWETWRQMPHCKLWGDAEWDFALDSIEVAAKFHESGDSKYATELRNREKIIGTTLDFLRDLRIRYIDPKPAEAASGGVTNLADYRGL